MNDKRLARMAYYNGFRQAAVDQFKITEEKLRNLSGLKPDQVEHLVADVHKRHEKLLSRIDCYIDEQTKI